ncbi:hypothetical protein I4U23_022736 [Adineta vaga]|nr:hypothetical protein I4U23_022736 [Adineta vaga]
MFFPNLCLKISIISMKLKLLSEASWDQNGITVSGSPNGTRGSSFSELFYPLGISITENDVLYIGDSSNHRVVVINLNSITDTYTIGPKEGSDLGQFNQSYDVFISSTLLYVLENANKRVQKMSLNGSNPIVVPHVDGFQHPMYLFVDNVGNIYVSDRNAHKVSIFRPNSINGSVVAGNGTNGSTYEQLDRPYGIFVNDIGSIYIADRANHRIMKWLSGAASGIPVAGNGICGNSSTQLDSPTYIIVDENEHMYISEAGSSRITRWAPNSSSGICIVACTGTHGIATTHLHEPHSLAFDSNGSLYVSDWKNHRVQKFQRFLNYPIPYNQPKLPENGTWDRCAITFADQNIVGQNPHGIFIDSNDTIYISHYFRKQILIWSKDTIDPQRRLYVALSVYTSLFVTLNGDIYFENGIEKGRIEKFKSNSASSEFLVKLSESCYDLFIDIRNDLYCSIYRENRVVKVFLGNNSNTTITIAGTDSAGSESYQLAEPWGIFVDINFNLYVADFQNHRIQLFRRGKSNGITVAGNMIPNGLTLKYPTDVILDANNFVYIADNENHRIIRVGKNEFHCIVGCTEKWGSASNELYKSYALRFDSVGNLYVVDEFNHRIQKFDVSTHSCVTSTTVKYATTTDLSETSPSSLQVKYEYTTLISDQLTTTEKTFSFSTTHPNHSTPIYFIAPSCENSTNIGFYCNISGTICNIQNPCLNNGTCKNLNNNQDYTCSCPLDFSGKNCQIDRRLCKANTCLNNGNCSILFKSTFHCTCSPGYEGVCRSLLLGYKCECLIGSYSGQHCENVATRIIIYRIVAKSFAYIAILAMITVALFVIIMDILKYRFGIDPTRREIEQIRRKKQIKRRKPITRRLVYVNAIPLTRRSLSTIVEEKDV